MTPFLRLWSRPNELLQEFDNVYGFGWQKSPEAKRRWWVGYQMAAGRWMEGVRR